MVAFVVGPLEFGWFSAVVLAVLFDDDRCPFPLSQWRGLFNCCLARRPKPKIGINWCCRVVKRRYDLWNRQWHTITYSSKSRIKEMRENEKNVKRKWLVFSFLLLFWVEIECECFNLSSNDWQHNNSLKKRFIRIIRQRTSDSSSTELWECVCARALLWWIIVILSPEIVEHQQTDIIDSIYLDLNLRQCDFYRPISGC